MKITVTNNSPDRLLSVMERANGIRNQRDPIAPGESRAFDLSAPQASVQFLPGVVVENPATPAPAAAAAQPTPAAAPTTQPDSVSTVNIADLPWPELRKLAIAAGAPKNVNKEQALALLIKSAG